MVDMNFCGVKVQGNINQNMERAELNETKLCELCGKLDDLLLCGGCKEVWYCCRDHQKCHWRKHKPDCKKTRDKLQGAQSQIDGDTDLASAVKTMSPAGDGLSDQNHESGGKDARPKKSHLKKGLNSGTYQASSDGKGSRTAMSEINNLSEKTKSSASSKSEVKIADYVMKCLQDYGICVVDNFMSDDKCALIKGEVVYLEQSDVMQPGELVSKLDSVKKIRGDKITWIEKGDPECPHISSLVQRLDSLILACNGRLGKYIINGRTKAMVACYPGNGTYYMRHVDNPNEDGRCVTAIYYLNKDWDVTKDGGLLRIFPTMFSQVADIEPKFDRLLLFWSDRRNPHEVQPAYRTRHAITVWYFDAEERAQAKARYKSTAEPDSALQ